MTPYPMTNPSFPVPYYPGPQSPTFPQPMGYSQAGQYQPPQSYAGGPEPFSNHINWCQGIEGAKSFPVPHGQSAQIMDAEGPYFYIKSVDQSGMPAPLRVFRYREEQPQSAAPQGGDYVTRQELPSLIAQTMAAMRNDGGNENA